MSKLSKADRDKLPASDFGDPDRKLFPIVDQSDVQDAASLLGKAKDPEAVKRRIIAIAKRKGFSIPDAWKSESAKHSVATFDLATTPKIDGDYVIRTGKVFEAGDYDDKDFAITPEEMMAAVADFQPKPVDLEHVPTPLDGKLGELRSVEIGDDGWSLVGTVALPKWLDDALEGTERKVSATWDRAAKTLEGLALVRNPRVSDAALMAAFAVDEIVREGLDLGAIQTIFASARHDTPEGQQIMQELHNTSARGGAVCKASNTAKMASGHESSTIQKVHDMTTEHGATCSSKKPGQTNWPFMFSRKEDSPVTNAWDWLKAKLEGEPAPEGASAGASSTATMNVADSAEFKALKEEQATLKAENQRIRLERIHDQAVAFADEQIRAKKAFPAEREAIVADFVQRATDDLVLEPVTVTFKDADGKEQTKKSSRVDMLRTTFTTRKAHALDVESLKPEELAVLSNRAETDTRDKPADEKRVKDLAEMTPLGRAHFAAKKNGTN